MVSKFLFLSNNFNFINALSSYSEMYYIEEIFFYSMLFLGILLIYINFRLQQERVEDLLLLYEYPSLCSWILGLQYIFFIVYGIYITVALILFMSTYFFPNSEVVNQVSPVLCHLSSSVPPSVSPVSVISPYEGCYVKFNEASLLTSSFKLKSYPYMVFGGVEPYTTNLSWKVPYFISDSKFYVLIEKIF